MGMEDDGRAVVPQDLNTLQRESDKHFVSVWDQVDHTTKIRYNNPLLIPQLGNLQCNNSKGDSAIAGGISKKKQDIINKNNKDNYKKHQL